MLPLWFVIALAAAMISVIVPLLQEKFKADGYALTFWSRAFMSLPLIPFVFHYGLPTDGTFYVYAAISAVIFGISDILYFRALPQIGSGMMTRLLPSSVMFTFVLWFLVEPQLLDKYLSKPLPAVLIILTLCVFVWLTMKAKQCEISWKGIKLIWPVIAGACIGPVLSKGALLHATPEQGVFAFICIEAGLMLIWMSVYYRVKKPIAANVLFSRNSLKTGIVIGLSWAVIIGMKTKAIQLVDNPGIVAVVFFTDVLWVMLFYKLIGRKEEGNIWIGLGIVACAVALLLLQNMY